MDFSFGVSSRYVIVNQGSQTFVNFYENGGI